MNRLRVVSFIVNSFAAGFAAAMGVVQLVNGVATIAALQFCIAFAMAGVVFVNWLAVRREISK